MGQVSKQKPPLLFVKKYFVVLHVVQDESSEVVHYPQLALQSSQV